MYRKHLRMARGEGEVKDSGLKSCFVERVVKLPMVHVAWDYATSTYTHLKESNKLVNFTLTNAEKSVSFVAEQAKPVVRKFEKQLQAVDTLACKGLGTLEQKVPIITKPPEQILGETRKLYSDTVYSRFEGIRNYSNGKVKSVADYGLQKAVDIFGNNLVQSVVTSVDGALVITERVLDVILPPVDGEFQNDVNNIDEKEKKSVLSRVGHLSSKLRHRAYKHLTQKVENLQERALDIMIYPIVLAQNAKENLEAAQNYAKALWETLSKEESEGDESGALIKLTRLGVKPLVSVYVLLRSILPDRGSETTGTSQDQAHSPADEVKDRVLWVVSMIPLIPNIIVMYTSAFVSRLAPSQVVNQVKDGILWTVGMLRLLPSIIVVYTFAFLSRLERKGSSKNHVDGILYKENEQNNEENHVRDSDGKTH